jgi:predicted adenine nucleotide alpha hydrolase (AANH) superfamily ATPase
MNVGNAGKMIGRRIHNRLPWSQCHCGCGAGSRSRKAERRAQKRSEKNTVRKELNNTDTVG